MKHALELLLTYAVVAIVLVVGISATGEADTRLAASNSLLQLLKWSGLIQSSELHPARANLYLFAAIAIPPLAMAILAVTWVTLCHLRADAAEATEIALIKYEERQADKPDLEEEARQRRFAAYKHAYEKDQQAQSGYVIEC